jgi:hypothetical protein
LKVGNYFFKREDQLGGGGFGTVYKGFYQDENKNIIEIAIKEITLSQGADSEIKK